MILLLNDDPSMLRFFSIMLEDAGHRVVTTTDEVTAWTLLYTVPVRLLVQDIQRPGMGGLRFYEQLRQDREMPRILVLFTTAYAPEELKSALESEDPDARMIQLPCPPQALVSLVHELVGESTDTPCTVDMTQQGKAQDALRVQALGAMLLRHPKVAGGPLPALPPREKVSLVAELLGSTSRNMRCAAAWALGNLGGREAFDRMGSALDDPDELVGEAVMQGMTQCADPFLVGSLVPLFASADECVAERAVKIYCRCRLYRIPLDERLTALIHHPDLPVCERAMAAFAAYVDCQPQEDRLRLEILRTVDSALQHGQKSIRIRAHSVVESLPISRSSWYVLLLLLEHPNPLIRNAMEDVLADGASADFAMLHQTIGDESAKTEGIKHDFVRFTGELARRCCVAPLLGFLRQADPKVRKIALTELYGIEKQWHVDMKEWLLNAEDTPQFEEEEIWRTGLRLRVEYRERMGALLAELKEVENGVAEMSHQQELKRLRASLEDRALLADAEQHEGVSAKEVASCLEKVREAIAPNAPLLGHVNTAEDCVERLGELAVEMSRDESAHTYAYDHIEELEAAEDAPIIRIVNHILVEALRSERDVVVIRKSEPYSGREDNAGDWRQVFGAVVARFRIASGISPYRQRKPVEGQFCIHARGRRRIIETYFDDQAEDPYCRLTFPTPES